jgi:hypothetical protein
VKIDLIDVKIKSMRIGGAKRRGERLNIGGTKRRHETMTGMVIDDDRYGNPTTRSHETKHSLQS